MSTQGVDNNHHTRITTYYNLGVFQSQAVLPGNHETDPFKLGDCLVKTLVLNYMPDYLRLGVVSDFTRVPITTSLGQFAMYMGSQISDINFSLRYIQGVDNAVITSRSQNSQKKESSAMGTLIQHMYSLALPQIATMKNGLPPPKSVLSIGSIFKMVGVFDRIDIEHRGPFDEMGNPLEAELTFNFIPTQFYDPVAGRNKAGINLETSTQEEARIGGTGHQVNVSTQADVEAVASGEGEESSDALDKFLKQSPAGNNVIDNQYTLYLGPR